MTPTAAAYLAHSTPRFTAFDSFTELRAAARRGFAPTLRKDRAAELAFGVALELAGITVYWRAV